MIQELSAWNNGKGIDLESWTGCSGNFKLAVGYSTIFWPKFNLVEDYIFREGFRFGSLRDFEKKQNGDRKIVEAAVNHLHIADIQHCGCEDISEDKIMFLGKVLKEIWETKLHWQFPDRPCEFEFYEPEDRTNLVEFQLTFWQKKHAKKN
jgi:hypothetical protein